MAPNKVYTWHEIMRNKTPLGKFLIFSSPYVCIGIFYYVMTVRPPSLLPTPTGQQQLQQPAGDGSGAGSSAAHLVARFEGDASAASSPNNNTSIHVTRRTIFGTPVEPIYGFPTDPNAAGVAAPKRRGWFGFGGGGAAAAATEEKAGATEVGTTITGYRFLAGK